MVVVVVAAMVVVAVAVMDGGGGWISVLRGKATNKQTNNNKKINHLLRLVYAQPREWNY